MALSTALSSFRSKAAAWLIAALIAQGTVVHYFAIRNIVPSLVLVTVVWYAMRFDVRDAALYGFFAGVGEDILSFDAGGAWTIATTISAVLVSISTRDFFLDSVPFYTIVTAAVTLVRALIFWTVKSWEGFPAGLGTIHLHEALAQAVLNGAVATVVMIVARHLERAPQ